MLLREYISIAIQYLALSVRVLVAVVDLTSNNNFEVYIPLPVVSPNIRPDYDLTRSKHVKAIPLQA
jgi:hypothetical protein